MFTILIIIVIGLCVAHVAFNYNSSARIIRRIPGPPDKFIIGNASEILVSPEELFYLGRRYAKLFKGIYRFWSFPMFAVNIYNPEDTEIILSGSSHINKSKIYNFLKGWLQDGLLLSSGSKWHQRRKILTPAFHFNILQNFGKIIQENSDRLAKSLEHVSGKEIDIEKIISEYTLHSLCETAMGTRLDEEKSDAGKSYKTSIYSLGKVLVQRFSRLYLHPEFIFKMTSSSRLQNKHLKVVHSFTKKVIDDRKIVMKKNGISFKNFVVDDEILSSRKYKMAMLDLLLSAEKDGLIDASGIQEEVDTFMFEGHDTTAAGLSFALLLIANHKEIQENIKTELREIFGDSDRSATMADLGQMKYLDRCIKESLRLYPPVYFISRTVDGNITLSNYTVPDGCACHIHIYDLHRREDIYEDPEKFDPNRFLPENVQKRHPYAFIPFSAGPRNCIGQRFAMLEMKSAISTLLRKFDLQPITKPKDIRLKADVILRTVDPIYITFVPKNL